MREIQYGTRYGVPLLNRSTFVAICLKLNFFKTQTLIQHVELNENTIAISVPQFYW